MAPAAGTGRLERKPGEESVQAPISGLLDSGGQPETPRPPRGAKGAPGGGRTVPSVPEVADAGEDHGDAHTVRRRHHFRIAHTPAGLNEGGGAVLDRFLDTIGEGEKGVGGDRSEKRRVGKECRSRWS